MPFGAFQEQITREIDSEKAVFSGIIVHCDELSVVNQRFLRMKTVLIYK